MTSIDCDYQIVNKIMYGDILQKLQMILTLIIWVGGFLVAYIGKKEIDKHYEKKRC